MQQEPWRSCQHTPHPGPQPGSSSGRSRRRRAGGRWSTSWRWVGGGGSRGCAVTMGCPRGMLAYTHPRCSRVTVVRQAQALSRATSPNHTAQMSPAPEGWEGAPTPEGFYRVYHGPERAHLAKRLTPGVQYCARVKAANCEVGGREAGWVDGSAGHRCRGLSALQLPREDRRSTACRVRTAARHQRAPHPRCPARRARARGARWACSTRRPRWRPGRPATRPSSGTPPPPPSRWAGQSPPATAATWWGTR